MRALDGTEFTYWKTAADSALGARFLAREDIKTLCMGRIEGGLFDLYRHGLPVPRAEGDIDPLAGGDPRSQAGPARGGRHHPVQRMAVEAAST